MTRAQLPLTVVVNGAADARRAAAAAAALPVPLTLLSSPGAAAYGGCGWFAAVAAQAAAELPDGWPFAWVIDCGDRAGDALEALMEGADGVIFHGPLDVAHRLAAVAAARGAHLLRERPSALSLRPGGDLAGACRAWLAARWTSDAE